MENDSHIFTPTPYTRPRPTTNLNYGGNSDPEGCAISFALPAAVTLFPLYSDYITNIHSHLTVYP